MTTHNTEYHNDIGFTRINNDVNGNPRYVVHFLAFDNDYNKAKAKARKLGFKVYRAKWYGGGFVTQSYNVNVLAQAIANLR